MNFTAKTSSVVYGSTFKVERLDIPPSIFIFPGGEALP
jgi:hypothetical protein